MFVNNNFMILTMTSTATDLYYAGAVFDTSFGAVNFGANDLFAVRMSLSNMSTVASFQYGSAQRDRIYNSVYN